MQVRAFAWRLVCSDERGDLRIDGIEQALTVVGATHPAQRILRAQPNRQRAVLGVYPLEDDSGRRGAHGVEERVDRRQGGGVSDEEVTVDVVAVGQGRFRPVEAGLDLVAGDGLLRPAGGSAVVDGELEPEGVGLDVGVDERVGALMSGAGSRGIGEPQAHPHRGIRGVSAQESVACATHALVGVADALGFEDGEDEVLRAKVGQDPAGLTAIDWAQRASACGGRGHHRHLPSRLRVRALHRATRVRLALPNSRCQALRHVDVT